LFHKDQRFVNYGKTMGGITKMKSLIAVVLVMGLAFLSMGCGMSKAQKGALIGAGTGTAAGAAIGKASGNTAAGAVAGAAVGGVAGGLIGKYMDKQAAEVKQEVQGAKVERVGEGEDAKVNITFDSGVLFDVDKAELKPDTIANLNKLAEILQKYPDTNILVEGHTDSSGKEDYNMKLSEKRAKSVENYMVQQKVDSSRMAVKWYGESKPIASNDTEDGKKQNRRVEISIAANDKLKEESAKAEQK
jgi:outer membrane protein OmpA-like peptidoglycan-associated protein